MGNDPNGVHVYIDTTLFLFSMTGSLFSVLKSAAVLAFEPHYYSYTFKEYCVKLMRFESFQVHGGFTPASSTSNTQNTGVV